MEIVLVPKKETNSQYPGLFLFTGPGRLIRPVKNIALNKIELIGTFEQVYLDICLKLSEAYQNVSFQSDENINKIIEIVTHGKNLF